MALEDSRFNPNEPPLLAEKHVVRDILRAIAIVLAVILILSGAIGTIRWAKRHSVGAQFLASAMLLVLGTGAPVVNPPQQGIEEAREDKGTKGSESGDPPTH